MTWIGERLGALDCDGKRVACSVGFFDKEKIKYELAILMVSCVKEETSSIALKAQSRGCQQSNWSRRGQENA